MTRSEEQREKHARIREILIDKNLDAIVLRKGANVAWFIGGRAHVPTTLELACLDLIIYPDRVVVVTNKIEAQRLRDEELSGDEELIVVNWFESRDAQLPKGERIGIDGVDSERVNLLPEIEKARRTLTDYEISRLRLIGNDATQALEDAMLKIESHQSEVEVAGSIARQMWDRDLEPVVLLVAGATRMKKYRHPLPTNSLIGDLGMGVICARRKGLIVSATRLIHFGAISSELEETYARLLNVESAFLDATRAGSTYGQAFKAGEVEYLRQGFERDEWTRHHQGGPTGYLPRDFTANEKSEEVIQSRTAIAWNPSAAGLKVEDTILTDESGFEFISGGSNWPSIEVSGRQRPGIGQR